MRLLGSAVQYLYTKIVHLFFKLHEFTWNCTGSLKLHGVNFEIVQWSSDCLVLVKVVISNDMDESAAFTTVQIALGFALCDFSVAMQFFPLIHDYLYK